jgi:AI-2 transport protein TqsA
VQTAVFVGLGILAIESVMGNAVGPRVQGRNVALSPLVVLVALAFWDGLGASSGRSSPCR